eukprot:TRINITY_DN20842_c0_g1_i1.p1 TRINITY_DN20842_c0_g1~~TRINITY_DN20842_c0_g1_i1.p1  ORF type:complete len:250 (-),score=59.26 TRINITY_DN20842_c0_g1_i1:87-836(-)
MAIDTFSLLYAMGDGACGCLGLGDAKFRKDLMLVKQLKAVQVLKVACGDCFTVVLAEERNNLEEFEAMLEDTQKKELTKTTKEMELGLLEIVSGIKEREEKRQAEKRLIERLRSKPLKRITFPYVNERLCGAAKLERSQSRLRPRTKPMNEFYEILSRTFINIPEQVERDTVWVTLENLKSRKARTQINLCYELKRRNNRTLMLPGKQTVNVKKWSRMGIKQSKSLEQKNKRRPYIMAWVQNRKVSLYP